MVKLYKVLFIIYFIISAGLMCYIEVLLKSYNPVLNALMNVMVSGGIIFWLTYFLNIKDDNQEKKEEVNQNE